MLESTVRDRMEHLLAASGRSEVPPFMVMDVMPAASAAAIRLVSASRDIMLPTLGQPPVRPIFSRTDLLWTRLPKPLLNERFHTAF